MLVRTRHLTLSAPAMVRVIAQMFCAISAIASAASTASPAATVPQAPLYIVQAASAQSARDYVHLAGARSERELQIIRAVAARLSTDQLARLRAVPGVRVYEDRPLSMRGSLLGELTTSLVSTVNSAKHSQLYDCELAHRSRHHERHRSHRLHRRDQSCDRHGYRPAGRRGQR